MEMQIRAQMWSLLAVKSRIAPLASCITLFTQCHLRRGQLPSELDGNIMDGVYMLDLEWVSTSFPNFLFYKLPLYASIMKLASGKRGLCTCTDKDCLKGQSNRGGGGGGAFEGNMIRALGPAQRDNGMVMFHMNTDTNDTS